MTKLSTETEVAWLDWLDAFADAKESGSQKDKDEAERRWNALMATFLPPEFRQWGTALLTRQCK